MGVFLGSSQSGKVRKEFEVSSDTLKKIFHWVEKKHKNGEIGWPNVFFDLVTAREFYHFLFYLKKVILIGIAVKEDVALDLLEFSKPIAGEGEVGIHQCLSRWIEVDLSGTLVGDEVLGFESNFFHSHLCYMNDPEFNQRLQLKLNVQGLFSMYEEAEKISEWIRVDERVGQ
jgi:hypothetical protein